MDDAYFLYSELAWATQSVDFKRAHAIQDLYDVADRIGSVDPLEKCFSMMNLAACIAKETGDPTYDRPIAMIKKCFLEINAVLSSAEG